MTPTEFESLLDDIATVVRSKISEEMAPVLSRLDTLENSIKAFPAPADMVLSSSIASVSSGLDEIKAQVAKCAEQTDGLADLVSRSVEIHVGKIPPAKDVDMDAVSALVKSEVAARVSEIPAPKDGVSVTIDDVAPALQKMVSDAVAAIPPAKDGIGVAAAMIDRDGNLKLTSTDGKLFDLGLVVGRDGDPARLAKMVEEAVEIVAPIAISKAMEGIEFPQIPEIKLPEFPKIDIDEIVSASAGAAAEAAKWLVEDVRTAAAALIDETVTQQRAEIDSLSVTVNTMAQELSSATAAVRRDVDAAIASWSEASVERLETIGERIAQLDGMKTALIEAAKGADPDALRNIEQSVAAMRKEVIDAVDERITAAIEAMPTPQDGKDADPALIKSLIDATLADIPVDTIASKYVEPVVRQVVAEIDLPQPEKPDYDAIKSQVAELVAEATAAIPAPEDGKDGASVTVDDVAPMIEELVSKAVASIPVPAAEQVDYELVEQVIAKAVAAIPAPENGKDGTSVTVEDVAPMIEDLVSKAAASISVSVEAEVDYARVDETIAKRVDEAVGAIPVPRNGKDGTSVTVDDVKPVVEEIVRRAVAEIPAPQDGVGVVDALIERDGSLTLTMSNGTTKKLGVVVGRDADLDAIKRQIDDHLATLPKPRDGVDGFGFEDLNVEQVGERGFRFVFAKGDRHKAFEFALPVVIDRGVFKAGTKYAAGDGVTFGGSFWIAQAETTDKPENSKSWRLAVKRGRDGKDGAASEAKQSEPIRFK